jgi:hypothetical protein
VAARPAGEGSMAVLAERFVVDGNTVYNRIRLE